MNRFLRYTLAALAGAHASAQTGQMNAIHRLANQPTGTYREVTTRTADGMLTSIESDLIFNRMGSRLELKSTSQYTETNEVLKAMACDMSSSEQTTHVTATVSEGALQVSTTTGGKTYERKVPFAGELLGPSRARQLLASRLHKAGDVISYQTFSPELGAVATIQATVVGPESVTVDQRPIPALKLEETMSSIPGKTIVWVDREGWMLRQSMSTPLGEIETIRTESTVDLTGATLPEETFRNSISKANVRLPQERLIESVKLKITHRRPEYGWPELEADNQKVLEKTPQYVILRVTRVEPRESGIVGVADAAFLTPNALLQSDDANVQQIARSVVGTERDPWRAALALKKWTNQNMHFDMGIAIAPASEVARERRGTCFGYSMLLGALTRAAGIPSRVRMGYVYAGGIWGGHAWVDVRIGDRWIAVDGALYSPGAADAARFSFFTSALEEGTLAQVGSLGQLLGNADVAILEYTLAGRTVAVPENARPFTIEHDVYRNPWLGFSVAKPVGFKFTEVDSTWPETTVVAMEGPAGQKIEIENLSASLPTAGFDAANYFSEAAIAGQRVREKLAGLDTVVVRSDREAGAVLEADGSVWAIKVKGSGAAKLLEQVAASMVLERR